MRYSNVKGLDKPVSQIILGTAWFVKEYEEDIEQLLDSYVAAGGNTFDTGRFYTGGKSEKVFAKWLKRNMGRREEFVITSKACHHYVDENNVHHMEQSRVSAQYITKDLEFSLAIQELNYFDLYMMHRDDLNIPVGELMDRLEQHRVEGKIRAYGVSNWSLERIQKAQEYCMQKGYQGISFNSPAFSLATVITPRFPRAVYADDAYIKWHKDMDIMVFAWGAQAVGFFADIYKTDGSAPADIVASYFSDINFARLERAKQMAEVKKCESVNVALAYVLEQDQPIVAVIAPHNVRELKSSLNALQIRLTAEEMEWLRNGQSTTLADKA